jgi:S1-C subfamily serine protease
MGAVKPTLIREFGIEVIAVPGGVKVTGVMGNSYASRAGVTAGDIVIECNGAKMRDLIRFQQTVGSLAPESNAQIKVLRNGRTRDLSIMVGEGEMDGFAPIRKP